MRTIPPAIRSVSLLLLALTAPVRPAAAAFGARLFKSGPIQVTLDGRAVWVANPHSDSVSRMDTATYAVLEFPLPVDPATRHAPHGLSVSEDGLEVWVACHDSDRVYVLNGLNGAVLQRIDLPWGSGPHSVALSRPDPTSGKQERALVTLHRSAAIAVLDVPARRVDRILAPVFWEPLGVAWMEDGVSAWVTHPYSDTEGPFLTRVDLSDPADPKVTSKIHVLSTAPLGLAAVAPGTGPAEGGYLMPRGHLAQIPGAVGRSEIWMPMQYSNIHDDTWSPDSAFESVLRRVDLPTRTLPNTNQTKVILSAVNVHDPTVPPPLPLVGGGWDAHTAGPIDLGFSSDGSMVYLVNELSDDVSVLPSNTPAWKPTLSLPLPEVPTGKRPVGIAVSPTSSLAYVANELSADVSVLDLATATVARPPVTVTQLPFGGGPVLRGAEIFHSSSDPRISATQKGSCASCHPRAEADGRAWALQNLPDPQGRTPSNHGPRDTMTLLGLARTFSQGQIDAATGFGELHRSGDRDEIQDFDHTFRSPILGGTGFIGASRCTETAPPDPTCRNAGRDPDLDALAAYVLSLEPLARSPHRAPDGSLSEAAVRGATFFNGASASKPADAGCAGCHVPETGFVDSKFYDVGQAQAFGENELNQRTPMWAVNTATLLGVWATPPYVGVTRFQNDLLEVVKDFTVTPRRAPHGTAALLTRRQLSDLAEFVGSIDGDLQATDVRNARDRTPPRIVRVEAASLSRISVWFSESMDRVSVSNAANWLVQRTAGGPVLISGVTFDTRNGDRVWISTAPLAGGCPPVEYTVVPNGPLYDVADTATGGVRNAMNLSDPANLHPFTIGDTLSITLGASGYETLAIPVHDVSIASTSGILGFDSIWLDRDPARTRKGFVRFDWEAAFGAATGVTAGSDILDAWFALTGESGDAQPVELRRVLQPWSDVAVSDPDTSTAGRTTWTHHAYNTAAWNQAGASALGGTGTVPSDYNGAFDLASTVDLATTPPTINRATAFAGTSVASAFRFWFANPSLDFGYAIQLPAGARNELKLLRSEQGLGSDGPVLHVTYRLPISGPGTPPEVSALGAPVPLLAVKQGAVVHLHFQDLGPLATSYNLYEGTIGNWFSHAGAQCNAVPGTLPPGRDLVHAPAAGGRYFQVTASNACAEGPATSGWPPALLDCLP